MLQLFVVVEALLPRPETGPERAQERLRAADRTGSLLKGLLWASCDSKQDGSTMKKLHLRDRYPTTQSNWGPQGSKRMSLRDRTRMGRRLRAHSWVSAGTRQLLALSMVAKTISVRSFGRGLGKQCNWAALENKGCEHNVHQTTGRRPKLFGVPAAEGAGWGYILLPEQKRISY